MLLPKRMRTAPPKFRTAPTPKWTSQKQNARVPCGASLPIRTPPNVPLPRVMMAALRLARSTWASVPSTMLQLLPWRGCAGLRLQIGLRLPGRRPSQPLCLLVDRATGRLGADGLDARMLLLWNNDDNGGWPTGRLLRAINGLVAEAPLAERTRLRLMAQLCAVHFGLRANVFDIYIKVAARRGATELRRMAEMKSPSEYTLLQRRAGGT